MSKIIRIYCEGIIKGHDKNILEKVIEGLSQIEIVPIGSIRGAGAIIQYKEKHEVVKSDFYILFRDRDFDKAIPENPVLEQDDGRKYCYYSYRNTIENYLFDTSLLYQFCKKNNVVIGENISEISLKNKLIEAAEKIKYYQAVRHTMGKMRTGDTNFGTKITQKSGLLPNNLDEEYCKNTGFQRIMEAKSITDSWTKEKFEENYKYFINKFNNEFINNLEFLNYFQGKDLATSFKTVMPNNFQLETYYKYAKKHFDYTKHIDLVELRDLINKQLSV